MFNFSRQRAFTLLEVLVAFAIAALALVVLMRVFSAGVRLSSAAQDYSRASMLAESLLAQAGMQYGLEDSPISGSFDERFEWVMEMTPYTLEDEPISDQGAVRLVKLALTIRWKEGVQPRSLELSSLRLNPRPRL